MNNQEGDQVKFHFDLAVEKNRALKIYAEELTQTNKRIEQRMLSKELGIDWVIV